MLTQRDLKQLAKAYQDRPVLTVYLPPPVEDPAKRHRRVVEFEQAIRRVAAEQQGVLPAEHEALRAAVAHVRASWDMAEPPWHPSGMLVVADAQALLHCVPLETRVPSTATWQRGIFVAPLLAEVSTVLPTPLLMITDRSVRRYRFTPPRHLELLDARTIRVSADDERHLGSGHGPMHPGTRGGTAREAMDQRVRAARERLYDEMLTPALTMLAPDGWLLFGGPSRAVAAMRAILPDTRGDRVIVVEGLDADPTVHEIARAANEALEVRVAQQDVLLVRQLLDAAAARGRAATGLLAAKAMLDRADVSDLLLSEHFVEQRPADADALLHRAFSQGARVHEVHGRAADVMDESAEGVMARLRYAMPGAP